MFPYRRNGPKKRGKGGHNRRQHRVDGGRRVPGSAGELLPVLQPTTKALAQMLAGNAKVSGQLVHARNIVGQAQRCVDERQIDRLPPAAREEFLEQLARLKLTLADADEMGLEPEEAAASAASTPRLEPDRLREVAMRLATSEPAPPPAFHRFEPPSLQAPDPTEPDPSGHIRHGEGAAPNGGAGRAPREPAGEDKLEPAGNRARERLRLKPIGSSPPET